MAGIFHRRKPSNSGPSEFDTVAAALHQQTTENLWLKKQIEEVKESITKSKPLFEQYCWKNEESEKRIQELRIMNRELLEKITQQEGNLKNLREVKFQLITEKDTNNPNSNGIREIQDLLDLVSAGNEMLIFRDSNDTIWELVQRNDMAIDQRKRSEEE